MMIVLLMTIVSLSFAQNYYSGSGVNYIDEDDCYGK